MDAFGDANRFPGLAELDGRRYCSGFCTERFFTVVATIKSSDRRAAVDVAAAPVNSDVI